jgi:hypothetical protein
MKYDIDSYLSEIHTIAIQIETITGRQVPDDEIIESILLGLPDSFEQWANDKVGLTEYSLEKLETELR